MAPHKIERTVIFGGLGIVVVLLLMFGSCTTPTQPQKTDAEKKAEDERSNKIALAATMAQALKRSMRDPDSFKLSSAIIVDKGAVC